MRNFIVIDRNRTDYSGYEYMLSKLEEFEDLFPYLSKKIRGNWSICFINPSIETVKHMLDLELPDYIDIDFFVEDDTLVNIANERPSDFPKPKSVWEQYLDLVYAFPKSMSKDCINYLFRRVGRSIPALTDALKTLEENVQGDMVTKRDITSNIVSTSRVYVSQVMNAFLLGVDYRWNLVDTYSQEYTFYASRKYLGSLIEEKSKYLNGENVKSSMCSRVDSMLLVKAYELFTLAESPKELIPILVEIDMYRKERKC